MLLYIERWLKAPVQMEDGSVVPRTAGTPQGGVISPCAGESVPALCLRYVDEADISGTSRSNDTRTILSAIAEVKKRRVHYG